MNAHVPAQQLVPEDAWFKSSYSDGTGNNCVEVASRLGTHDDILIRDSKDKSGPALCIGRAGWDGLLVMVRADEAGFGLV